MTTAERGKGTGSNKFSRTFKKNGHGIITNHEAPHYSPNNEIRHNRSASASVARNQFNNDRHITMKYPPPPQNTTTPTHHGYAYSMTIKKFNVFNDEDDDSDNDSDIDLMDDIPTFTPPLFKNRSSVILEQNPLATTPNADASTPNPLVATPMSLVDLSNIMQEIDDETEKININITDSEDEEEENEEESQSYSYSYHAIQDDTAMEEYPPGYTITGLSNKRKNRGSCIDNDEKYKRRKSNRKDVWRRMMTSIMDGVGTFGANALQMLSEYEVEEDEDEEDAHLHVAMDHEHKYNHPHGINPRKYVSVTNNTRLFRHNGYTVKRRLSSHEGLQSRYTAKCYRRKNRPRSKSDPSLLPFTTRFNRKLEPEYRPGTMNIFQLNPNKKKSTYHPQYPTRAHQDSIYFRYVFDDSDLEDDSLEDWSDDEFELGSPVKSYIMQIAEPVPVIDDALVKKDTVHSNNINGNLSVPINNGRPNPNKLTNRLSFGSLKSLNVHRIGKTKKLMKSASSAPLTKPAKQPKQLKQPIRPYGGHVEASESMIENEFGSNINHINVYSVKKRNKLGRDIDRMAVLDIPLQVLRIKDKKNKTHKEHIVSSISASVLVGSERFATQIIIQFHDNRDYFLSFASHSECVEFRDLIEKLRKFNFKMLTARGKHTRDDRAQTVIVNSKNEDDVDADHNNFGFFDDDDEVSISRSYSHAINLNNHRAERQHQTGMSRQRFDTEMFDNLADDGNVYTGMQTANVVYRIVKINKWGTKKERTMIVHKSDRTVRLFDDKRRCHSEYPLKIMATLDIIDSLNVEVVFLIDQKPTRFVFRSHVDLWDFVEQIRTVAPNEIMVSDRRQGKNKKKATILPPERARGVSQFSQNGYAEEQAAAVAPPAIEFDGDDDFDINPNVLRYSVLRLIKSQARGRNQQVTWRQHRRCIYLDLEKRIVRMLTLGMHIKDYRFEDILLLEKSYINVNQLHITCKHKSKIKEYWYEFISPQARAEFVGRLLGALPGTQQAVQLSLSQNPLYLNTKESELGMDPNIITQQNLSPLRIQPPPSSVAAMNGARSTTKRRKPRRKRLSPDTLQYLMSDDIDANSNGNDAMSNPSSVNGAGSDHFLSDDDDPDIVNPPSQNTADNALNAEGAAAYTEDPLSIIVGSWNVSESEINFANLKMWIPPSKIESHDIYVIGLQECAASLRKQWIAGILRHIDSGRKEYVLLNKAWLMGIGIIIIVHRSHITKISHLHAQVVPTGKGNIIGNKGATAISFQFQETSFAFINAHLAARAERFEKRAKNFGRIIKNLELGRPGLDVLHQFTHTFFLGDLNYRIEKDFYETVELVKKKQWSELIKSDQLSVQMRENHVFYGFKEGEINFCPTYRWERNKNTISNKREQPPSYCDRILYRSLPQTYDLWQECYLSSHRCFGSDHRPVWSIFKFKPKMPYFTSAAHDHNMINDNEDSKAEKNNNEYKDISISLVELQASFKGALKDKNNKKIQIHLDDVIDIILHYNYSAKAIRLKGGQYDENSRCWRWPLEVLDALRIKPFITDPHFICRTHIFVCFVNVSKGNLCIGYSIISLFNAFPKSLIETHKLIKEFKSVAKQMSLMPSPYNPDTGDGKNTAFGNKQFDIPILLYGNPLGNLTGFVYADGKIVEKHRKITNLDLLSRTRSNNIDLFHASATKLPGSKTSLFKRASARFIGRQHSFQ